MVEQKEFVSIIVPTYNRDKTIVRAINSIRNQTYENWELILVDDGSVDATEKVVSDIGDERIVYLKLEKNAGAAHARNIGMQQAKYDYIAFLDSDDEWLPDKLLLQMREMQKAPGDVGLIYSRMANHDGEPEDWYVCPPDDYPEESLKGDMLRLLLTHNVIGTPTMLLRKECIAQTGGFREELECLEDWEFVLRVAKNWKIGFIREILTKIHQSAGSVSTRLTGHLKVRCYIMDEFWQELMTENLTGEFMKRTLLVAERWGCCEEVKNDIMDIARKHLINRN